MERQLQLIWDENRKYQQIHEGWVSVLSRRRHGSASFVGKRMVLKRKVILLYDDDRLTDAVILGANIRVTNVVSADSQPGFGFEIESLTSSGQAKSTCFMFKQQNERDYWKALILAMLQGTIPKDVNLLPGQVAHIRELISQSATDFPASTHRSPSAEAGGQREMTRHLTVYHPGHGPGALLHHREDEVDVVYELSHRQRMLSQGMLEKEMPRVLVPQLQALRRSHSSDPPSIGLFAPDRSSARRGVSSAAGQESRLLRGTSASDQPQQTTRSPPVRQEDWSYVNGKTRVHPFYRNSAMNGETPFWFIDCNREIAETVLSVGRRYGNLLMRPGTTTNCQHPMCYALSYRSDDQEDVLHYAIIRQPDGFKIDVDDEHAPMLCLSDVVEYFMNFVGSGVKPFKSNDLNEILHSDSQTASHGLHLAVPSSSFPSSPPVVGHCVLPEQDSPAFPSTEDISTPYQSPGASLPPLLLASSDYLIPRDDTDLSFPKKSSHQKVTFSGNAKEAETVHKALSKHNSSSSSSGVCSPTSDRLASPLRVPPPPLFPLPSPAPETVMEDKFLRLPPKI